MDRNHPVCSCQPVMFVGRPESVEIAPGFDALFLFRSVKNAAGEIVDFVLSDANDAGEQLISSQRAEWIGHLVSTNFPDGLYKVGLPILLEAAKGHCPWEDDRYVRVNEDEFRTYRIKVASLSDGLIITVADVTAIRQAEAESAGNKHFIGKLTGALSEFIYVLNVSDAGISFQNRDFMSQLGYPSDDSGCGLSMLPSLLHTQDQASFYHHTQDAIAGRDDEVFEITCRIIAAKGDWKWFQIRTTVYQRDEDQQPIQLLRTIRDVSAQLQTEIELRDIVKELRVTQIELRERQAQLQQLNQQLASLATTDGLTSLYNFRAFHEKLAEETRRAKRYLQPLAVVMADIDNFKIYNDRFGHPAGDERLRYFARILREGSRNSDYIARYGGEEFAMILSNTTAAGAAAYAQGIIDRLRADPDSKGITASFGCVELEITDETKDDLVRRADECLYAAKRQGKNRFVVSQVDSHTIPSAS